MGAPKQKWTSEEEEALRAGVAKHGTGKWKNIQKDPEFGHCLAARSYIDLKIQSWYKIKNKKIPCLEQEHRLRSKKRVVQCPPPQTATLNDGIEDEAAITAAYRIADAENKSFLADTAVKEAERVAKMAEESDSLLQLGKEIFERCLSGEIVSMA